LLAKHCTSKEIVHSPNGSDKSNLVPAIMDITTVLISRHMKMLNYQIFLA
jgi:hypothetical protein